MGCCRAAVARAATVGCTFDGLLPPLRPAAQKVRMRSGIRKSGVCLRACELPRQVRLWSVCEADWRGP